MLKSTGVLAAAGALSLAALTMTPGVASASTPTSDVISFTGEANGGKPNGYLTAEDPDVRFSTTFGATLSVSDFGVQSHGKALSSGADNTSGIEIRLDNPTTGISLAFGNDDPGVVNGSDQAELLLYRTSALVGQVDVNVNANDAMDQTITYGGGRLFNRAVFRYVDAAGNPKNLIEIIDDVSVNPLCTISGGDGHDNLTGTSGADVICGDQGNDSIHGGGGNDLVYPGPGADHVWGGGGADTVMGSAGNDVVVGGKGSDDLRGGAGRDHLFGGLGNDKLTGGTGRDACDGGPGNDYALSCEVKHRVP